LALGRGRRLFGEDGPVAQFGLVDSKISTTGVVIASYRSE
jgi:hypothetical protein